MKCYCMEGQPAQPGPLPPPAGWTGGMRGPGGPSAPHTWSGPLMPFPEPSPSP